MFFRKRFPRWVLMVVTLAGFFGGIQLLRAQAQAAEPVLVQPTVIEEKISSRGMDELVSLDLRSTEVGDALKYLATRGELNLAISRRVSGRVNIFLTDVPIRDVFDLILRSNELAYDRQGSVYNVMTEAEYRGLYGEKFSDLRQVKTFRLRYAAPSQAFNLLDTLKSEIGRLLVDEGSGTVLIMDTPGKIRDMEKALATLEAGETFKVFDLQYANVSDVEATLKEELEVNKLGTVRADTRSGQLLVRTWPQRMKEVETIISALDRKTREVLIDAKIVKVTLTDDLDTGIDWNLIFSNLQFHGIDKARDFRTAVDGTAPSETPAVLHMDPIKFFTSGLTGAGGSGAGSFVFGTVARDGYELFRYLKTIGETKLLSNPRILVTENEEARIHVGTKEAYVTTTTTTGQTTTTTAEEIEFIDVGIQLTVTPSINRDGYVTMKIKPDISSVVRLLTTPSGNEIPIVDTSTAETRVMVKDGETVIIGGLRSVSRQRNNDEIPILGRIPFIGELFRQRDHDDEKAELVVFITPHIITGDRLVTGDEWELGGGIGETFRDYAPIIKRGRQMQEALPTLPLPAPMGVRPRAFRPHVRERLRDFAGTR